jgi:hypothetical protein
VYTNISEKTDADVTQIREYVDDKFSTVSGDMQLARRNAEEISKLNDKLKDLQNKLTWGNYNTPQSADLENASDRAGTTDQQAVSASRADTDTFPNTAGINVSSNSACQDSNSIIRQTVNSGVCTNVNVQSEMRGFA